MPSIHTDQWITISTSLLLMLIQIVNMVLFIDVFTTAISLTLFACMHITITVLYCTILYYINVIVYFCCIVMCLSIIETLKLDMRLSYTFLTFLMIVVLLQITYIIYKIVDLQLTTIGWEPHMSMYKLSMFCNMFTLLVIIPYLYMYYDMCNKYLQYDAIGNDLLAKALPYTYQTAEIVIPTKIENIHPVPRRAHGMCVHNSKDYIMLC